MHISSSLYTSPHLRQIAASAIQARFSARRKPEPPVPDLHETWQLPEIRIMLENFLLNGMFRQTPDLARRFLLEVAYQSRMPYPKDRQEVPYRNLHQFLQQPAYQAAFLREYEGTDNERVETRCRQVLAFLPKGYRPKRFLDIGYGNGKLTSALAKAWQLDRFRAQGVEVEDRTEKDVFFTKLAFKNSKIPVPKKSQDLATLFMVLHHEAKPLKLINEAYRVLKPKGFLLVRETDANTPVLKRFNAMMEHFYYKVFNNHPGVPNPVNHKSATEWEKLFLQSGFRLLKTERPEPNNPFTPVHFLLQRP